MLLSLGGLRCSSGLSRFWIDNHDMTPAIEIMDYKFTSLFSTTSNTLASPLGAGLVQSCVVRPLCSPGPGPSPSRHYRTNPTQSLTHSLSCVLSRSHHHSTTGFTDAVPRWPLLPTSRVSRNMANLHVTTKSSRLITQFCVIIEVNLI